MIAQFITFLIQFVGHIMAFFTVISNNIHITGEAFKRMGAKLEAELLIIQKELLEIDKIRTIDVDIIDEVITLTQNIVKAYDKADIERKRAYLKFFFKEIRVKDKKIVEIIYQPVIDVLTQANRVLLSTEWLRIPRINRTDALSSIIKAFQNPIWAEQARERLRLIKKII